MTVQVSASLHMLALALRVPEAFLRSLDADELESLLGGEVYRRFPKYEPDTDGNSPITYTVVRMRRYELVIGGPSLNNVLKGIYTEEYVPDLTFRNSPWMAMLKKRKAPVNFTAS